MLSRMREGLNVEIKFIEVTHAVTYARGEVSPAGARIIGVAHIAMVSGGDRTRTITLSDGSNLEVLETYDDLKRMLGL
jgi:hypothetical protein